ncbi:MAG: metalloregulator ArsR/SmtB family transcription factor [Pseudomonadota bacterium]
MRAADVGSALGITAQGAQQHLAKSAAAGLIEAEDRKQGRGRPRRYWRLTAKGHSRFPDRHSDLTLGLLKSTEQVFGAEGLEQLIRHREAATLDNYERELRDCTTLEQKVERLSDIRSREGYMAEWQLVRPGEYLLVENHCPVCAAASVCQGLCRSELDIFRAVLGPKATVERTDHILAGARRCAYEIASKSSRPNS